jgi:hypothetical protein
MAAIAADGGKNSNSAEYAVIIFAIGHVCHSPTV